MVGVNGVDVDWRERASILADGPLAARAAEHDRAGAFPARNFADLHSAGVLALTVPAEFSGAAAGWHEVLDVLRILAGACASTANALNMHLTVLRAIDALAAPELRERVMRAVVDEGAIIASLTSEPKMSLRHGFALSTRSLPTKDGFCVEGVKQFASMSTGARWYHTLCDDGEGKGLESLHLLLIPADSPGVEVLDDWDTVAMRATASNSVRFEGVAIPRELEVGPPGAYLRSGLTENFTAGYAAVYLGVAEAAHRCAIDYARTAMFDPGPTPLAEHPGVQRTLGSMGAQLAAASALLERAARAAEYAASPFEVADLFQQAKLFATDAARRVTADALEVCGGRGLKRGNPLERCVRDAHAGPLMQPSNDTCRTSIGRRALGLDPWGALRREP